MLTSLIERPVRRSIVTIYFSKSMSNLNLIFLENKKNWKRKYDILQLFFGDCVCMLNSSSVFSKRDCVFLGEIVEPIFRPSQWNGRASSVRFSFAVPGAILIERSGCALSCKTSQHSSAPCFLAFAPVYLLLLVYICIHYIVWPDTIMTPVYIYTRFVSLAH